MIKFFPWKRAWHSPTVWFSLIGILTVGLIAALAPILATHDPYKMETSQASRPPAWVQNRTPAGMEEHLFGTDRFGRDIFSRLIYGTRTAFFLALTAVPIAAIIGTLAGLAAGYTGGRLDAFILFLIDTIQTLPGIMFMVIIVLIFREMLSPTWINGLITLIVGFTAVSWASLARLIRINVMLIKSQLYVEAASALGASPRRIIAKHLLPNVLHVVLVWIINNIPAVILLEALLGYIGVGVTSAIDGGEFTVVSWGGMFFAGRSALSRNPMMLIIPSVCILLISMCFFLLGDFLNESTRHE